jgi:hypothetical protein
VRQGAAVQAPVREHSALVQRPYPTLFATLRPRVPKRSGHRTPDGDLPWPSGRAVPI